MSARDTEKLWEDYCQQELALLKPILEQLGFSLSEQQVHLGGERYIFAGKKLVLLGQRLGDGQRVIIKASRDKLGLREIRSEVDGRRVLDRIDFAYHVFLSPPEILFTKQGGYIIFITAFIEQKQPFLERPLTEQFFLALKGLEAQEGAQATTYEHHRSVSKIFSLWQAKNYLEKFSSYQATVSAILSDNTRLKDLLGRAHDFLQQQQETIDLYSGFLVHWDFVPHNFRLRDHDIYLLDHSSLRFGNKYESWARFINFMVLHNPSLEQLLLDYLTANRSQEESLSLQLMRLFRLGELLWYYASTLDKISGDLNKLNRARIDFWTEVLETVLDNKILESTIRENYKQVRDSLRTPAEKQRQKELH